MKKSWPQFGVMLIFALGVIRAEAGTISYVAIPAAQSDANCGISTDHGYTSAVDGGNTRGTDRIINGITLYALTGNGQNSSTADNCTLNALSGTLTDSAVTSKRIQADGTMRDALSAMVVNNGGGDNSQQEIVLDPESLEEGSTYDLRVYVSSSSGQNRQVSLAFFGDGQNAAETGFFNEDDARTSAGGFKDANQVYYINFRYTWDGDSTPGITITQRSGGAPFCLYALTNELVSEGGGGAAAGEETAAAGAAGGGAEAAAGGGVGAEGQQGEGLSSGLVDQESDEVGVQSDDFYNSESLNSHGRWIKLSKWGTCWQPTDVPEGWCPYTNGNWKECDDCGWTFDSDEPWAWACYHYGRWCKVKTGCGWAWVPGKVWAASWVSWRRGRDESSCSCIGWAPLPPEAGCEFGVGISSWVDETCNIGPECYTFVNIRDFGSDSYWGCGCIYERSRNTTIIIDTFNCTNICHTRIGTYCGGPDFNWCNTEIRRRGGRECGKIYVNRYDNAGKLGGKFARREGNQLGLVSPRIRGERNPKHMPKTAENVGANKIDHGWGGVNKKQEGELKQHIAQETKGKNPKNSPATLPPDVAQKLGKQHGARGAAQTGQAGAGTLHPGGKGKGKAQGAGLQAGAAGQGQAQGGFNQHPGKGKGQGAGRQGGAVGQGQAQAGFDQHPGGKGRRKGQGQVGGANAAAGGAGQGQHPGKGNRGRGQAGAAGRGAGANALQGGNQQAGGFQGGRHPGQSLKKQKALQGGAGPAGGGAGTAGGGGQAGQGGKHKGRGAQGAGQAGGQQAGAGAPQGTAAQGGGGQGQGRTGKGRHKQGQGQMAQQGQQAQGGQTAGGGGGQGKGRRRQQQQQQAQGQGQTYGQGTAGGGGGGQGKGRHRQQQQAQGQTQSYGQGAGGGRRQQQQYQQQQRQQQQQQQQQQGGRKGRKGKPTPAPY